MAALIQVGLALVLIVSAVTGEDKCRTGCHGVTPNVFKFAEGTTYKYDYDGYADLSLSSSEGDHSKTRVKASVLLTQQGQCNQVLRVQNLQITSGDSKKYSNIANIEKPIVLNFHDGHIEDVICTEPSDTQISLNIKRAIASMFQAALKHHGTEIDVFGSCPTDITQKKEGPFQVIRKIRNLNKCAFRESLGQTFMSTAFDQNSEIKSSPFLQGKYEAELKLKGGIPQVITVDEDYLYVPFSNGNKGAKANVNSQLKFAGVSKDNPKVSCNIPRSIIFEDPHPIASDKNSVGIILKAIKDAANAITLNVKENSASKFASIIKLMRGASKEDLSTVYGQVRSGAGFTNKEIGKRIFVDALLRTRTGDAVEVAIDIYKSSGFDAVERGVFFGSLNFVQHATEGALSGAASLLTPDLPLNAYLGIGALANRYCRQHSCENVKGLKTLLNAFQSKLKSRPADKTEENVIIATLKAIRNSNHVTNSLAGKIIEIAQDKQAASRLRVAALEAYRADACNERLRDSAINILKDIQLDSEIRIKAYLALVECADGKVATAIKKLIDDEPSVQVGGFIVSHLGTLRSSANPDKARAKAQLGEIRTTKKYPFDFRQYSFNVEGSYDIDSLGIGDSIEGNVIYSQKSFLPRSVSLNLTTEVFGHRYNFLELDTRQENLDALLSSYIGPNGVLRSKNADTLFQDGAEKIKGTIEKVQNKIHAAKQKREVNKNQIENFGKQLTDKQSPLNKDLHLDVSLKLFGSELVFVSLDDDIKKYNPTEVVDNLAKDFDKAQEKVKDWDHAITSNLLFLDSRVSYPTSIGFPLRLSLEGTTTSHLETSSKIQDGNVKLKLIPSISVEVAARFVVDAGVVESGLTVVGNLYSSVGGVAEASWIGDDIKYKFSLPLDKQEILTVTHNILFETRELCGPETKKPLKFVQSKDFSVCLDQLKPYLGLTVCADINQPNIGEASSNILPFPLNGNSKLSVTILKNNFGSLQFHHATEISAFGGSLSVLDPSDKSLSAFKYRVDSTPFVELELQSQDVNGKFYAGLNRKNNDYYGLVSLEFNKLEYYVKLGTTISQSGQRAVYQPIMEYKTGQGPAQKLPYHIDGQIISEGVNGGGKYTFNNVKLVGPSGPPLVIAGNIAVSSDDVSADLSLDDGHHRGTLKGKAIYNNGGININLHFTNTFDPNFNFDVKHSFEGKDLLNIKSNLQVIHGADLSNKNAVFKLLNRIEYVQQGDDPFFGTEHELSYPAVGLDNKFKLETKKKSLDIEVRVGYKNIKLGTELEVEIDKKNKGDFEVDLELYGFDNKLEVELERAVSGYKSKIHHKITLNGNSIEVQGEVKHLLEQHRGDIAHDLLIKITSRSDVKWKSEVKFSQNDIDIDLKIQNGQDVLVDGFLKAQKFGDANGNLKLNIPGQLTANGNIKANKGVGKGQLVVNLVQLKTKLSTEAQFTLNEETYTIKLDNTLESLGQKSHLNVKVSRKGDITNFDEGLELELILPSEQYFAGKIHRDLTNQKGVYNGQSYLALEQRINKNAPGKTLSLKGVWKDCNPHERLFDITYTLGLDDGAGQTLNGELALKKSKTKDEGHIDYNGKLYGSLLSETLQGNVAAKYKGGDKADFKVSTSYGKGATLNVKGKYDQLLDNKKPGNVELQVDVLTPNSLIRLIKYTFELGLPRSNTENVQFTGSTTLFVDDDGKEQGATIDVKYDFAYDIGEKEGHTKDEIAIQNQDPLVLITKYKQDQEKEFNADVSLKYKKDKEIRVVGGLRFPDKDTLGINVQLETPLEKAKTVKLQAQIADTATSSKIDGSLTVNDLKYIGKLHLEALNGNPSCNLEVTYPTGKVDQLYGKVLRYNDEGFAVENKIILHAYEFTLDSNVDVVVKGAEDFTIKFYFDSPKLKADKISLTANTKDVQGAKKLVLNAKQAGTTIVDGTMTYKIRKEDNKVIVDGSGQLTVNKDKKSGNFKVLYRELNKKQDQEDGIELTINSIIGNKGFDIEYILTDDHFKYLTSYCVEKKDCAHVEVEWKDQNNVDLVQVNIDLRPLGISHEFGLKSETDLGQLKSLLDVHLLRNQYKYQYNAVVLPTEARFTLTTPNRIVSLEAAYDTPNSGDSVKGHVVFYFNKKAKPQEKTLLEYEASAKKDAVSANIKLSAPPLKKPLLVSYHYTSKDADNYDGKLVLDIIPNSNNKIIIASTSTFAQSEEEVSGTVKNIVDIQPLHYKVIEDTHFNGNYKKPKYDFGYSVTAEYHGKPIVSSYSTKFDAEGGQSKLVIHNKVIYEVNAAVKSSKEVTAIDVQGKVIGSEPYKVHLEVKNDNTLKVIAYKEAKPNDRLQVNCGFIPGSIADFRMELQNEGKKVDLVHGFVKLDEADFGKSDYGIDSNNIDNYVITPFRSLSQTTAKATTDHMQFAFAEAKKEFKNVGNVARASKPDINPIISYYEAEFKALREELITDESLKQFTESLDNIIAAVATVTVDLIKTLQQTAEKLIAAVHQQSLNLADMFEKDILPKLKEIVAALADKTVSLFESVTDLCFGLLGQVTSFFDAHQDELKQIATKFSQASKDIFTFVQKVNQQILEILESELNRFTHEIKSLPVLQDLEKQVKDILANKPISEESIATFKAHAEELKAKIPLKKVKHLIDLTVSYIEKKLRDQACDDQKEIRDIIIAAAAALEDAVDSLFVSVLDWDKFDLPLPSKILDTLPEAFLTKASLLTRILNGDIPSIKQLQSFATLNPRQLLVPLRKYAIVVQGQHIFTFDNKHLTFPGKCSYLLAKDVVNNEFSIAGVYVNGALSELTFIDKTDTITLKKNGAVTLNGAATEYPVRGANTDAFRTYHQVHLKSNTGVNIYCEPDLSICLFGVSGFYHGQLRGLLGNANAEPYDDYTTAKGVITASESDFGNSYKLQGNCPGIKTVDHHSHHHAESCTKLFTELSELSPCYVFVNPTNFRQACDHGVAAGIANTEAAIAHAYALACYSKHVPTFLPSEYLKCGKVDLYDTFSVKLPQKAADVVFAIDARPENEAVYKELVQGLSNALIKDLGERGIKDIEYHVLTFGGADPEWPSHITSNGGKMTFRGKLPNVKFSEEPDEDAIDWGHETINFAVSIITNYLQELKLALGLEPQSRAYLEAVSYPFRTNAVKSIIAVSSRPCQKSELFHVLQKLRAALVRQPTIELNLITPLGKECDFKVKDEKTTKNVIGFNKKGVFTIPEAKTKPTGNPDLLKELNYDDFCSEYTVGSGGNVFVLDNFNKNKKLFTSVASFNIAESLVSSEQGLDCACVRDGLFTARNICVVSYSKDKPPTTRKLLKGR